MDKLFKKLYSLPGSSSSESCFTSGFTRSEKISSLFCDAFLKAVFNYAEDINRGITIEM